MSKACVCLRIFQNWHMLENVGSAVVEPTGVSI